LNSRPFFYDVGSRVQILLVWLLANGFVRNFSPSNPETFPFWVASEQKFGFF
jgi:hypothetical protein